MSDFLKRQEVIRQAASDRIESLEVYIDAIHRVEISNDVLKKRIESETNWTSLSYDYLREITERLYLIDLQVSDLGAASLLLDDITQENGQGQAPFGEIYFDVTGRARLGSDCDVFLEPPQYLNAPGHLRFFLHYVDLNLDLIIDDRSLKFPKPTPIPQWLEEVMPYQPPN